VLCHLSIIPLGCNYFHKRKRFRARVCSERQKQEAGTLTQSHRGEIRVGQTRTAIMIASSNVAFHLPSPRRFLAGAVFLPQTRRRNQLAARATLDDLAVLPSRSMTGQTNVTRTREPTPFCFSSTKRRTTSPRQFSLFLPFPRRDRFRSFAASRRFARAPSPTPRDNASTLASGDLERATRRTRHCELNLAVTETTLGARLTRAPAAPPSATWKRRPARCPDARCYSSTCSLSTELSRDRVLPRMGRPWLRFKRDDRERDHAGGIMTICRKSRPDRSRLLIVRSSSTKREREREREKRSR